MKEKLEELKAKVAKIKKEIEKLEKEDSKYLDLSSNYGWFLGCNWEDCYISKFDICIRTEGIYKNKAFYLNDLYNWEIVKDDCDYLVLLPTKK